MINWIKNKLGVTAIESENKKLSQENQELRSLVSCHERFVKQSMEELKDYTRVDADIGIRGNNTVILTGVYRNKGYVKFYDIGDGEFNSLIDQMKHMNKNALIRNIDKPPSFHGVFDI